jgi:hypothetical protein
VVLEWCSGHQDVMACATTLTMRRSGVDKGCSVHMTDRSHNSTVAVGHTLLSSLYPRVATTSFMLFEEMMN